MSTAVAKITRHYITGGTSHHYILIQGYDELMPALERFTPPDAASVELWLGERLMVRRTFHPII